MPNIPELEQRWFSYRLKKVVPYVAVAVITIILICLVIIIRSTEQAKESTSPKIKTTKHEINTTKTLVQPQKYQAVATKMEKNSTQPVLHPSMGFLDNVGSSMLISAQSTVKKSTKHTAHIKKKVQKIPSKNNQTVTIQRPQAVYQKSHPIKPVQKVKQINSVVIHTTPVQKDMKDIIQRFKETNNPMLSLFLAKRYYQQKKYALAYNYALITNQLDKSNDASWIIFAKSLVKLGQKKMAVNILQAYIKNSDSVNAQTLLHDIESGVFK